MSGTERQALQDALDAEYAAVYAYGLIAAYGSPERGELIAEHTAAHRARRDATIDALSTPSVDPPPPESAYTVPSPVTDPVSAGQLAATVEADTAVAWRSVVERGETDATRRTGIEALTECAVRQATWQTILGADPPTTPLPGQP